MKNLKEIIDNYNQDVEFPFLGNTLIVTKERNIFNQIRMKFIEIANRASIDFAESLKKYNAPGALYKGIPEDFKSAMKEGMDEVTKDAISVDCYTLDANAITKFCTDNNYFKCLDDAMEAYKDKLREIYEKYQDSAAAINYDTKNHPYLQTATIGGSLADVATNQMKADVVNAIIGGVYESSADSKLTKLEAITDKEIQKFHADPTYKNKLINAVWRCSFNLIDVIYVKLNRECKLGLGGIVKTSDVNQAEAIHNNLKSGQIPEDKQKELALSILNLQPWNIEYYRTFMNMYLDNSKETLAIAKFFNIDLSGDIKNIMKEFALRNLGNSFEEIKGLRELVNDKIYELGFPSGSEELAEDVLQKKSADLLNAYFRENIGETRAEALACFDKASEIALDIEFDNDTYFDAAYQPFVERMDQLDAVLLEELNSWIDENLNGSEDEVHKLRDELDKRVEAESLDKEKAVGLYKKIDDRLVKLDEEYRTIEGFIFPTRETADEIKAIINDHKDILYKETSGLIFRNDYITHIEKIKTVPLIDKLILHFVSVYEGKLKEFDKKCKNAKIYDDKMKGQKKSFKSLARSMFVSDEKQLQDWNEVTHNGQYPLNEIMGISSEESANPSGGFRGLFGKK